MPAPQELRKDQPKMVFEPNYQDFFSQQIHDNFSGTHSYASFIRNLVKISRSAKKLFKKNCFVVRCDIDKSIKDDRNHKILTKFFTITGESSDLYRVVLSSSDGSLKILWERIDN